MFFGAGSPPMADTPGACRYPPWADTRHFFVRVGWTFMWVLDAVFETVLHGVDEGVAAYARKAEGLST